MPYNAQGVWVGQRPVPEMDPSVPQVRDAQARRPVLPPQEAPGGVPTPQPPPAPATTQNGPNPTQKGFNVEGARKAGYSDDEILQHLTASRKFDVDGAVKSGYSKQDIINHLSGTPASSTGGSSGSWEPQEGPAKRFLKNAGEQLNPVSMVKGAANMVMHPSDTVQADVDARGKMQDAAKEDFHQGSYMQGVIRTLESLVPLIGPQLDSATKQMDSGDVAGGLGKSAGLGLSMAAPAFLGDAAKGVARTVAKKAGGTAETMARGALKPSGSPSVAAAKVRTILNEELPVGNEAGVAKGKSIIEDLEAKKNEVIDEAGKEPVVDPVQVAKGTDPLKAKLAKQVNPKKDLRAVNSSTREFLDQFRPEKEPPPEGPGNLHVKSEIDPNAATDSIQVSPDDFPSQKPPPEPRKMSLREAQDIKQGTDVQLNKKNAYGELKTANVESQKYLTGALRKTIAEHLPQVKDINARQGGVLNVMPDLERAAGRNMNKGSGPGVVAALTGGAVGVLTGSKTLGSVAATIKAMFDNPTFRSKLAIQLHRASKGDLSVPEARAKVAGYAGVVARSDEGSDDPIDTTTKR